MRGVPHAPKQAVVWAMLIPRPRKKEYMRGTASRSDREGMYMRGFTPHPNLGNFFGKKFPKNPKKPDWIGFRLSNKDREQGCRRQPCFCVRSELSAPLSLRRAACSPQPPDAPLTSRRPPHSPVAHPALTVVPSVCARCASASRLTCRTPRSAQRTRSSSR